MADPRTIFGTLGDITFRADESPSGLSVEQATRYESIGRVGQKPLLQATGDELNKLKMSFVFTAGWCKPDEQLKRLQEAMNAKQPLALGWGNGRFDGNYVIESIGSAVTDTMPTGEVLAIEVDVSLIETTDEPVPTTPEPSPYVNVRTA